jgi:hypothetical protein
VQGDRLRLGFRHGNGLKEAEKCTIRQRKTGLGGGV